MNNYEKHSMTQSDKMSITNLLNSTWGNNGTDGTDEPDEPDDQNESTEEESLEESVEKNTQIKARNAVQMIKLRLSAELSQLGFLEALASEMIREMPVPFLCQILREKKEAESESVYEAEVVEKVSNYQQDERVPANILKHDSNVPSVIYQYEFLENTCTGSISIEKMTVWNGDKSIFETILLALFSKKSGVYWNNTGEFVIDWDIFGPWVRAEEFMPRNDSIRRRLQNYNFRTIKRLGGNDVQLWEHTKGFKRGTHCDFETLKIYKKEGSTKVQGSMRRKTTLSCKKKRKFS